MHLLVFIPTAQNSGAGTALLAVSKNLASGFIPSPLYLMPGNAVTKRDFPNIKQPKKCIDKNIIVSVSRTQNGSIGYIKAPKKTDIPSQNIGFIIFNW